MNEMIKTGIIFAAGATVGYVASYFINKNAFQKKANKEIEEVREIYRQKASDFNKNKPSVTSVAEESDADILVKAGAEIAEGFEEGVRKVWPDNPGITSEDRTNYSKLIDNYKGKEDVEPVNKIERPKLISFSEYDEDDRFEKVELIYYVDDDVVADQYDEVYDINDTVGYENLSSLTPTTDAIYVKNTHFGTKYEVTRDERSFAEVTGIFINGYRDDA